MANENIQEEHVRNALYLLVLAGLPGLPPFHLNIVSQRYGGHGRNGPREILINYWMDRYNFMDRAELETPARVALHLIYGFTIDRIISPTGEGLPAEDLPLAIRYAGFLNLVAGQPHPFYMEQTQVDARQVEHFILGVYHRDLERTFRDRVGVIFRAQRARIGELEARIGELEARIGEARIGELEANLALAQAQIRQLIILTSVQATRANYANDNDNNDNNGDNDGNADTEE